MKQFSIKTRIFLLALIPTLFISVLLGTFLIASRVHDLEKEQRIYAITLLNHIVNISRNGIFKNDKQELQEITEILHDERQLQSITFYNKDRKILAYGGDEETQVLPNATDLNRGSLITLETKDTITLFAPVIIDNLKLYTDKDYIRSNSHKEIIGWIAISLTRSKTILEEYQTIIFTLILLGTVIAISAFFAIRTAKYLTIPLIKIRRAIKKIEQGELDTRINTEIGGEVHELETGINQMVSALQQNIAKTTAHLKQSLTTIETQNIELARAQKEALDASRIKSEFIANMSHEIRTPMNSIVGYTNLLLETELSALQRNYLTTIQKSTLNLLDLINNVLDFSRLDAGQLKLDYILFDLRDCIEEILSIMSPLASLKQLEFTALIDEEIPQKILSDPLRIKQIIINLVSNAIKFTDQGEIVIYVMIEKKTAKSVKLRIAVTDTGIGLSEHVQKTIFKAFQQADTSIARKYGGTGLGLAICKKLVEQMAGKLGVESEQKKGSTFWFSIIADRALHDDVTYESSEIDFSEMCAILYEPHPISRQALKNILHHWKINVVDFADFDLLKTYLKTNNHHKKTFLIACINQQTSYATSALPNIKEIFSGPVITLTNSSEQAALEYFITQGASASLTKPIMRKNLYHIIFQLMYTHSLPNKTIETTVDLTGKHILCVDDNLQNANLVKALLENTHATITIANDGNEALQLAERQTYDLILMDLRMPNLDGYETLKILRSTPNPNRMTQVIAVSAHISDNEQTELFKVGFNGYLVKPLIKATLLEIITQHANQQNTSAIDWNLGLKLAANKRELAMEILELLCKKLPDDLALLKQAKEDEDYIELLRLTHKLHGALCYCGVPRLKNAAALLEIALKQQKYSEITALFDHLMVEANELLNEFTQTVFT